MIIDDIEDLTLEHLCKEKFAVDISLRHVIARDVYTGHGSYTTVFEDDKRNMYALCDGSALTLADVKEIIHAMGMEADSYFPPDGQYDYFVRQGKQNFLSVFPARTVVKDDEIAYYQTLAAYSPALVRIRKIKGEIREYSPLGQRWQTLKEYTYTHMQLR